MQGPPKSRFEELGEQKLAKQIKERAEFAERGADGVDMRRGAVASAFSPADIVVHLDSDGY